MGTVIIINNESFGKGDEELGKQLMGAFLRKIWASPEKPECIVFYNSGVKHLGGNSSVLEVLSVLEEQGVELVACGTCVNHYELKEDFRIGRITDMTEILSIMMQSNKVITV